MEKVLFSEKQRFPRMIVGIILFFTLAILCFAAIQVQRDDPEFFPWFILICLISITPVLIIFWVGVEIKITDRGIYYRALPLRKKPIFIPKEDADLSYQEHSKLKQFGRYGIKYQGNKKFLLLDKHNIQIKHGKKTITIGTKKPQEFKYFLENSWKSTN